MSNRCEKKKKWPDSQAHLLVLLGHTFSPIIYCYGPKWWPQVWSPPISIIGPHILAQNGNLNSKAHILAILGHKFWPTSIIMAQNDDLNSQAHLDEEAYIDISNIDVIKK